MKHTHRVPVTILAALLAGSLALSGCKSNEAKPDDSAQPAKQTEAAAPEPEKASAPGKPICKEEPKTTSKKTKKSKATKATQPTDCIPASEAAAQTAQEPAANGSYNLSKNKPITDCAAAEAGKGAAVKGIDGWEGEISGVPARGSKFTRLKIGMSTDEVFRLIGQPSGFSSYPTGKSHIPFYHGADRWRQEGIYKGQGRLIFSQQGGWGGSGYNLIWIIHCANEQ